MSDKLNAVIDDLVEGLSPLKPMRHPMLRIVPWVVFTALYLTGTAFLIGIRHDFADMIVLPFYQFEMALLVSISLSAALASAWLCVPDMRGHQWMVAVPISLFFAFCLWIGSRIAMDGLAIDSLLVPWHHCAGEAVFMIALPVVAILFVSRKGRTTRPRMMAFINVLAVSAAGYATLRVTCAAEHLEHIMPYHMLPYLALGVVLGVMARRFFRW